MKKFALYFVFASALALLMGGVHAHADEGWVIEGYASELDIQESGVVNVTEIIDVDFGALTKHGIYRDIPVNYKKEDGSVRGSAIGDVKVYIDDAEGQFTLDTLGDYLRIKIGDPERTISGRHSYHVFYSVTGILQAYPTHDELYWNATGNGWGVPIMYATATVALPQDIALQASCYEGFVGATESCKLKRINASYSFAATRELSPGEGLTVAVGYKSNVIPILTVAVQEPFDATRSLPALVAGMVASFVVGMYLVIRKWWRRGRDEMYQRASLHDENARVVTMPLFAHETIVAEYDPPAKITPALMALIREEKVSMTAISATITDLAVRGYLEITEVPKTGIFSSTDYEMKRTGKDIEGLAEFERLIFGGVFANGVVVKVSDLKNQFYKKLPDIRKAVSTLGVNEGYFVSDPQKSIIKYALLAVLILILGIAIATSSQVVYTVAGQIAASLVCGLGIGMIVLFIPAFIIFLRGMPKRTANGREMLRQIKGYELFINNVEKYRQQFFEREGTFMNVLPYAMIFGATDRLADAFRVLGYEPPQPGWYHGAQAFNFVNFNRSFSSFTSNLASSMASAPRSSGSGGSGFSGGGFGGGGGGSW